MESGESLQAVDWVGMGWGLAICSIFGLLLAINKWCFSVSDERYEEAVAERGELGRLFVQLQREKYGSRVECNERLYRRFKEEEKQAKRVRREKEGLGAQGPKSQEEID